MKKTLKVAMTPEEYKNWESANEVVSKLTSRIEELKNKKIAVEVVICEKHFVKNIWNNDVKENIIVRKRTEYAISSTTELPQAVRDSLNSAEFIAEEYQRMYEELNKVPNWIRKIFKWLR